MNAIFDRPRGLAERRLTARVCKTWRDCAGARLPSWADIQTLALDSDWESCFAIDLALSAPDPYFIYVGDALAAFCDQWLSVLGERQRSLMDTVVDCLDEAVMTRKPVSISRTLPLLEGERIAFRSVVLPLSDNGADVTHAFGAANGRRFRARQKTHAGRVST